MLTEVDAAFFDADETLLDTSEFIHSTYRDTLAEFDIHLSLDDVKSKVRTSIEYSYATFAPGWEHGRMIHRHRELQSQRLGLVKLYPGTREFLEELKSRNTKIGIVSARAVTLVPSLEHVGIMSLCDVVVDGNAVRQHKPHPEGIWHALRATRANARRSVMVGDKPTDIQAGQRADLRWTVGITHGSAETRKPLQEVKPTYIVESIADLARLFGH
jgi:pyrophosphatase PpaX